MRVFIVGATGVLGRNVIPRLLERGHEVHAIVRQDAAAERLAQWGVKASIGDILDEETMVAPMEGCDIALQLATAVPRPGQPWDMTRDAQVRRDGTRSVLAAASRAGVRRYLQQSITFIYGDRGTDLADENAPLDHEFNPSTIDMEDQVRASGLDWTILRGGWFYGPTSGMNTAWYEGVKDGTLRLPGDGSALVSLVHEVDMSQAIILAAESASAQTIYNVVDDQPVTYRELYGHIASLVGAPVPEPGAPLALPPLGCLNTRLKEELNWQPAYPTYRSGLV